MLPWGFLKDEFLVGGFRLKARWDDRWTCRANSLESKTMKFVPLAKVAKVSTTIAEIDFA